MRKFIHCRRGTISLMTVIVMVPLIAVLALGGEAGTWYITKQHAQNAADAAAYAGGLKRACEIGVQSGTPCGDAQSVSYRGKQFAARNAFCNAGDAGYPGATCNTALTQTVAIDVGTFAGGAWTTVAGGSFVRATITQQQPKYLAAVYGAGTVTIGAQAIAQVSNLANPCVLALTGSISFQGSPNINAPNCGMASNGTGQNAIDFTGGVHDFNVGSLSTAGGCSGTASQCGTALTHMPPTTNPYAALDTAIAGLSLPNCSGGGGGSLTAYTAATPCKNNNVTLNGNTPITATGGVYFISGQLRLNGTSTSIVGDALLIMLPGSSLSMRGGTTINLSGPSSISASQLPPSLRPYASTSAGGNGLLDNMVIYDAETKPPAAGGSSSMTFGGNSNITLQGTIYAPNVAITFQGNPTIRSCGEIVAASIAFNGNATFTNTGCSSASKPSSIYVSLVR